MTWASASGLRIYTHMLGAEQAWCHLILYGRTDGRTELIGFLRVFPLLYSPPVLASALSVGLLTSCPCSSSSFLLIPLYPTFVQVGFQRRLVSVSCLALERACCCRRVWIRI